MEVASYWQPDFSRERKLSWSDSVAQLRELATEAVQLRLQSDVPVGVFLSGGVDSSIVVGLMSKLGGGTGGINTYPILASRIPLTTKQNTRSKWPAIRHRSSCAASRAVGRRDFAG